MSDSLLSRREILAAGSTLAALSATASPPPGVRPAAHGIGG